MKTQITSRLFYKKFPFKVRLKPQWAVTSRIFSKDQIAEIVTQKKSHTRYGKWVLSNPKEVYELSEFFSQYSKDEIQFRIEVQLSVFFKDMNILNDLLVKFPKIVETLWKPANDQALDHMMDKVRVEIKPKLTHDCRYKIFLKGKMGNISNENRLSFIRLYKRNSDEFVLPKSTQNDFERPHNVLWGSPYFYVKDSKYLLMAQMLIQPLIKETVKMVTLEELSEKENVDAIENC
jgi:hypothetical protein